MKKPIIYTLLITAYCQLLTVQAQQPIPAKPQTKPLLIVGATAHLGNGQILNDAAIAFDKGKITQVTTVAAFSGDKTHYDIVDGKGKHIYPGFIALNSILGLTEIEAARATNDFNETGSLNPNIRSIVSYNTDSKVTPTVRFNGVLMAQITPQGGRLSGQSSVVELDGWNWEDAVYKTDEGLFINWPAMVSIKLPWLSPEENANAQEKTDKELQSIYTLFKDAKAYSQSTNSEINMRFESMRGLFNGTKKLYVKADFAKAIASAVLFSKEMGIKMVLVGGTEALKVSSLLRENNIPVVLGRTHSLPSQTDEDISEAYKLPYLLKKEGILCCISVDGFWQQRNLPFNAGTAAAYGLTKEEALQTITANAASILGIDKTVGTLEVGKDATLIISTGDALDMRTNNIELAYIRGKQLQLTSIQQALYNKYMEKYSLK